MLTHPILDQLAQLGLTGMAQAFAELEASGEGTTLTHADWLGLLVDREMTHRRDKRLAARLRYARLRHNAVVEDVDYRAPRGLDRALFHKLAGGEWIEAHDNLILCGPTGVGKSWLACALGHKACRDNRSVLYQRVPKLFADLALARGDGRHARIMQTLTGAQLLIQEEPAFLDASVRFAGNEWVDCYGTVKQKGKLLVAPEELGSPPKWVNIYERNNFWLLYSALAHGINKVSFITLWDGKGGDGPGGTQHMVEMFNRYTDKAARVIDPATLSRPKVRKRAR